jgi:hypothetical protein
MRTTSAELNVVKVGTRAVYAQGAPLGPISTERVRLTARYTDETYEKSPGIYSRRIRLDLASEPIGPATVADAGR